MIKWVLIISILFGGLAQACDYRPLNPLIIKYTGKSPYEWGLVAGTKTRNFLIWLII